MQDDESDGESIGSDNDTDIKPLKVIDICFV